MRFGYAVRAGLYASINTVQHADANVLSFKACLLVCGSVLPQALCSIKS